jgi:hypothetical protein
LKKLFQFSEHWPSQGRRLARLRTFRTVVSETSTPSLMSSPWILFGPQSRFSLFSRMMSSLDEGSRGGLPLLFVVHFDAASCRCHLSRVSCRRMRSASFHPLNERESWQRMSRSVDVTFGREDCLWRTISWYLSRRFSFSRSLRLGRKVLSAMARSFPEISRMVMGRA